MSFKNCAKLCHRKPSTATACSIQFDEFFQGNQSRPSAAKSAGIVGKWGITSFTSIRNSAISGRRNTVARDSHTFKRSKRESGYKRSKKQRTLPTFRNEEPHSMLNKPKKFFKSRNMHTSSGKPYGRVVRQSNHEEESDIGNTPNEGDLHGFVSSKTAIPIRKEVNPPIVLRICKGTSRLVSAVDSANPHTSPAISVSELRVVDTEIWNSEQQRDTSAMTTQGMHGHNTSEPLSDPQVKVTRACAKPFQSDGTPRTTPDELLSPNLVSEHECVDISIPYRETLTHKSSADLVQGSLKNNSDPPKRIIFAAGECSNPPKELSSLRDSSPKPQIESLGGNYRSKCDGIVDTYDIPTQDHEIKKPQQVSMCNEESQRETITVLHRRTSDKTSKSVSSSGQSHLSLRSRISLNRDPDGDCSQNCDESDCISNSQNRDRVHASVPTLETDECTAISNRSIYLPAIAKKGSIFKTRNTDAKFTGKRRALYKHKWSGGERESKFVDQGLHGDRVIRARSTGNDLDIVIHKEGDSEPHSSQFSFKADLESGGFDEDNSSEADVRGENKEGDYYTVIKNVKKAHQIQESGEFQEFNDDIEYILDTLRENNPNPTRCLSAFRLASKCMIPAFRMHVRAHGTVTKFFRALHDATTDQSLALCTAAVMFVLSQDQLAMDLDRDCLELMLSLLESDTNQGDTQNDHISSQVELTKNIEKVKQLCAEIQSQGHAKHLNLDHISVSQLAMETLLSLTSKRAGEWFKEELRKLGGLEHIMKTVTDCYECICSLNPCLTYWDKSLTDQLSKICRCLRILENVTHMNQQNQKYLLEYGNNMLITTLSTFLRICCHGILKNSAVDMNDRTSEGVIIRECLFSIVKVLINLTHRFGEESHGGRMLGTQDGIMQSILFLLLKAPYSVPREKRFDIMMLTLILLINITEKCEQFKKLFLTSDVSSNRVLGDSLSDRPGLDALVGLFYEQEELARAEEQKTDAILDGSKDSESSEDHLKNAKSQEEFIEETVTKLLQKAGQHMEHTFIAAYVGLLIGYLVIDDEIYEDLVRNKLPDGSFKTIISVLRKFLNFMNLTASNDMSSCGMAATERVITFLQKSEYRLMEKRTTNHLEGEDIQ